MYETQTTEKQNGLPSQDAAQSLRYAKAAFFLPKSRFTGNIQYTIMPKSAGQEQNSLDRLPAVRKLPLRGHGGNHSPRKAAPLMGCGAQPRYSSGSEKIQTAASSRRLSR